MDNKTCHEIFKRLEQEDSDPKTELNYLSPFELLVAVILSAQATDKSVNKATNILFTVANTPETFVRLGEVGLKKYIQSIGLYNSKCANIIKMSQQLIDKHQSTIPSTREALEALPGVGRKSANVILNTVFGEPVIAVDTHIFRVGNRTQLAPGKNVKEVEEKLMQAVPDKYKKNAHHWLVLHGRYTCTAKKPHCSSCVIEDLCEYADKNIS